MITPEASIHKQVINYLKFQYPRILFRTDFAAGIKLTIGQAVKHKSLQQSRAWPDLFIAQPARGCYGLFIELKRDLKEVYKKNGNPVSDHVKEQLEVLQSLRDRNYMAVICIGFDHAKDTIDHYLIS